MPLHVTGAGPGEPRFLTPEECDGLNGRLVVNGPGSAIEIGPDSTCGELEVEIGTDCMLRLGRGCNFGNLLIYAARDAEVSIGAGSSFNGRVRLLLHEPGREGVPVRRRSGRDGQRYALADRHRDRIPPEPGARCDDRGQGVDRAERDAAQGQPYRCRAVIGAGAVVTGQIPANVVAAGVPARVLRKGVTWRHDLI